MAIARVYRNLNNGLWSIKQRVNGKWVVIGHASEVELVNVTPYISNARHDYVRQGNHREVFAWLVGDLIAVAGFTPYRNRAADINTDIKAQLNNDDLTRIYFHPFSEEKEGFKWDFCVPSDDFTGAWRVYFDSNSKVWGFA